MYDAMAGVDLCQVTLHLWRQIAQSALFHGCIVHQLVDVSAVLEVAHVLSRLREVYQV